MRGASGPNVRNKQRSDAKPTKRDGARSEGVRSVNSANVKRQSASSNTQRQDHCKVLHGNALLDALYERGVNSAKLKMLHAAKPRKKKKRGKGMPRPSRCSR